MDRLFGYLCSPIVIVIVIVQMKTIVVSYNNKLVFRKQINQNKLFPLFKYFLFLQTVLIYQSIMDTGKYIKECPRCDKEIKPKRFATPRDGVLSCVMDSSDAVIGFLILSSLAETSTSLSHVPSSPWAAPLKKIAAAAPSLLPTSINSYKNPNSQYALFL